MLPRYLLLSISVEVICKNAMACRVFRLLRQFNNGEEDSADCSVEISTLRFRQVTVTGGRQEGSTLGGRQEGLVV